MQRALGLTLFIGFSAFSAFAENGGYQDVTSGFQSVESGYQSLSAGQNGGGGQTFSLNALGGQQLSNPVLVSVNNTMKQLQVQWPTDTISFGQIQSLLHQFPAENMQVQFPNHTNWSVSSSQLGNIYSQFQQQAASLGFGSNLPDLTFSSLANPVMSGLEGKGMLALPISMIKDGMKGGMQAALRPALRELRYEQLSFSDMMPDVMKSVLLEAWNFLVHVYDTVVGFVSWTYNGIASWVSSFF